MIDAHTHALAGWTDEDAAHSMQICGFDKAILAAAMIDHWRSDLNEGCARMIEKFPGKLVGLVGIDPPNVDQSLRDIETYGSKGFVGVKLMPTTGYYPDDERCQPVFEEVNARKWIVLTHCGWASGGRKEKDLPQSTRFSDPYHIEPLARIFTDTDFILAHGGGRTFFPRAWELCHYHENVYIDTCPGQGPWALQHGGMWLELLKWDRVLFGTDMLLGSMEAAQKHYDAVQEIKSILREIGFAKHTHEVMHGNAEQLLRKHGVSL